MQGIIYCAINKINGKAYIGQSVQSLKDRIRLHRRQINRGSKSHFHCAINKYGWDSFVWNIIDTADSVEELKRLEMVYIEMFGTYFNGYNMTIGAEGGGNKISEEHKRRISEALKGRHQGWHQSGYKHTEEAKQKISSSKIGNTIARGRVYINNGDESKMVHRDDLEVMIEEGWALGRLPVSEETRKRLSAAAHKQWQRQRGE